MDVNFVRGAIKLWNILPAKSKLHLLVCMPKQGSTPLILSVMAAAMSFASTNINGLEVHSNPIGPPILADLESSLGLKPEDLPTSIGGMWTYESHRKWCRSKLAEEVQRTILPDTSGQRNKKKRAHLNEEKKQKKIKSLNVIHSRQKRERRKAEMTALQQTFENAARENQLLKAENARLQQLVETTRAIVATISSQAAQSTLSFPPPPTIPTAGPALANPPVEVPNNNLMEQAFLQSAFAPGVFPPNTPSQPADLQMAVGTLLSQPPVVQALLAELLEQSLQRQVGAPIPASMPLPGWTGASFSTTSSSDQMMQGNLPNQPDTDSHVLDRLNNPEGKSGRGSGR
jgi:hypothetical protein